MVYITVKQSPSYRQLTLEEFLFGAASANTLISMNETNTRTYEVSELSARIREKIAFDPLVAIQELTQFNLDTAELRSKPRESLYSSFRIPKKSGGSRKIDAPSNELKLALYKLKSIFETTFHTLYHTSAFAYIKGRSTIDCVKRHQSNKSRWFAKLDLSNFFGSTTLDFVMSQFEMIYPFSEVCRYTQGKIQLRDALELAFLNGGLPQGTPISPLITNIMMIPIDHTLSRELRRLVCHKQADDSDSALWEYNCIYTRYADDFIISSRYDFRVADIEKCVTDALAKFNAPFSINRKKTRYGSSAGSNWNLGVMLNKDNAITIGNQKKRQFQATLSSYVLDHINGTPWDVHEIQAMDGLRSYYRMVEGEVIDRIVKHVGDKYNVDIPAMIKNDIHPCTKT